MKPDTADFKRVLDEIPRRHRLDSTRVIWLRFAFHFTDIRNAVAILTDGKIKSRAELEKSGGIPTDIASPTVISKTGATVKDLVRMYFRPRTPTQYRMEGIRPNSHLWEDCHCPVPIFFLFDLFEIITRDDSSFSDSNLAKLGFNPLCTTALELETFDFQKIFHVDRLSDENKQDVVSHRNAEIVIPKELGLDSLKYIYCRTPAEKDTLLHLLPQNIREKWAYRVHVESRSGLFYREWTYIETVTLSRFMVTINFSPDARLPGPFNIEITCHGLRFARFRNPNFTANGRFRLGLREPMSNYDIEVLLDGNLAYAGRYEETGGIII